MALSSFSSAEDATRYETTRTPASPNAPTMIDPSAGAKPTSLRHKAPKQLTAAEHHSGELVWADQAADGRTIRAP